MPSPWRFGHLPSTASAGPNGEKDGLFGKITLDATEACGNNQ
jgi:hypothetical protein